MDNVRRRRLQRAQLLVQRFAYDEAERELRTLPPGSDVELIRFNIMLNLCREAEAREKVMALLDNDRKLDHFECVMLRNAIHLCHPDEARELLRRADMGFMHQHGGELGQATTLNNLGVLEIWAKRYDVAHACLSAAQQRLEAMHTYEVYQPITNLAVLHALRGDIVVARRLLRTAKAAVKDELQMDDLMIEFNELTLDLLESKCSSLQEAVATAVDLYTRSRETRDLRFRETLAWFANQLEEMLERASVPRPLSYRARIRDGQCCGLEVFTDARIGDAPVTVVLHLSPHWRYEPE